MNHFWTFTIWYIILWAATIGELLFIFARVENRRLVCGLYLTLTGIVLGYETMILIIFKAYAYYPLLLQTSPYLFDRVLAGSLFSQFSVSATALLVAVLNLDYRWSLVLAAGYGLIEELFLAVGIYSQNWYRTWMTVLGMLLLFRLAKKIHATLLRGVGPLIYYTYVSLGLFPLYVVTILWSFMVPGHLAFSTAVLADPVSSRYMLCLILFIIPAAAVMMFVRYSRLGLVWKTLAVSALIVLYHFGAEFRLIIVTEGLLPLISAVTMIWMYLSVLVMDRLYQPVPKKL